MKQAADLFCGAGGTSTGLLRRRTQATLTAPPIMKVTFEELELFRRELPVPTKPGEMRRVMLRDPNRAPIRATPDPKPSDPIRELLLTARLWDTPERGRHLRWVANCDLVL